ncbi:hypothetical protein GCM10011344_00120 [Dokdonia pacifica]|nr:hypothetical protein GCM10011344_00120 [Dokdonia pacifica]
MMKIMAGIVNKMKVCRKPLSIPMVSWYVNIKTTRLTPILKKSEDFLLMSTPMIFVISIETNRKCGFNPHANPIPSINMSIRGVAMIPVRIDLSISNIMIQYVILVCIYNVKLVNTFMISLSNND